MEVWHAEGFGLINKGLGLENPFHFAKEEDRESFLEP
jgi:hypothetical protein